MQQYFRIMSTWCEILPWCSCRGLVCIRELSLGAGSWVTAAVVAELTGRHERNLVSEIWKASSWERRGSGRLAAEAPVLSERLFCRAEQVSAEQLSPSLEANTLWIIVIYPQGAPPMLRSLPSCPSAFPLPSCRGSSILLSSAGLFTVVVP